jgi:hypothetical protein
MLFRGRDTDWTNAKRFDSPVDEFVLTQENGLTIVRVAGASDRVVAHFVALSFEMPAFVDVAIDELRTGRSWRAEGRPLSDARHELTRVAPTLAEFGGVEWSLYTREDQLTVTPDVELYIMSRTDRWLYLLEGRGIVERRTIRGRSWQLPHDRFPEAPALVAAIGAVAEHLGLVTA